MPVMLKITYPKRVLLNIQIFRKGESQLKSTGIIVEYNPFHNGHLHHLRETRRMTGAECIIAVMSGYFMQRGEPALVSKWTRAEMAVLSGADLVVELPYAFAVQPAEKFAAGGIAILDALQCKSFCFGSESGDIEAFRQAAAVLLENEAAFNASVKREVKKGISYPAALSNSFQKLAPGDSTLDLSSPNNILGFHYMLAAARQNPAMEAFTVQRKAAGHHDVAITGEIASASATRKTILQTEDLHAARPVLPEPAFHVLSRHRNNNGHFLHWALYWPFLHYRLLSSSEEELRAIYEVEEGIEYRLKKAAASANSFPDFMEKVKTKRYTWTRLQRICTHLLTNAKKAEIKKHAAKPSYIRLLAMNETGRRYLNSVKKTVPVPIISKFSLQTAPLLAPDIRAARIYALPLPANEREHLMIREFSKPPFFADEKTDGA